ncbi:S-adenosyl-L-methionine-dependent methyltransferase [Aspergillus stella-maris]|uniref:S-adenosyl-L-methionine-dependent methyltransferase n=1 Tax=Aspergillus stella-maris TaxID=1810926 RepID=UPI003CCD350D
MSSDRVAEVAATLEQLVSLDPATPASRADIVGKCQSVITALKPPEVVIADMLSSQTTLSCLVSLNNIGTFEKLSDSEEPLTASQLAQLCAADEELIVRLMRVATAGGFVSETGPRSYSATAVTRALSTQIYVSGLRWVHFMSRTTDCLPDYFKEIQHKHPTSNGKTAFNYHFKTSLGPFEWMARENGEIQRDFIQFMANRSAGQAWSTYWDAKHRIFDGVEINPDAPLLVDIGGGVGQDLHLVKKALGHVSKGQLVVEDQASTLENIPEGVYDPDFVYQAHDFFTPQPIKGARIYQMKAVMHDWSDDRAVEILRHTAASMKPGYSKVWIIDRVLPETGANKMSAWQDICMMATLGGLERTREQFKQLLSQAGLIITDVTMLPDGIGLVQAELEK